MASLQASAENAGTEPESQITRREKYPSETKQTLELLGVVPPGGMLIRHDKKLPPRVFEPKASLSSQACNLCHFIPAAALC